MTEAGTLAIIIVSLFAGALFAFGAVLLFVFFGSNDTICHSALYGFVSTIL